MSSILRITDPIPSDNSIDEYEYFEYSPIVGANLNNFGGDIRITIETQDIFTHPSESFLLIEGQLTKDDDTLYANADVISLTNNGMMYLFKNIKYQISEPVIEQVQYPGKATTMLGLLKYPDDFSKSQILNQLWHIKIQVLLQIWKSMKVLKLEKSTSSINPIQKVRLGLGFL